MSTTAAQHVHSRKQIQLWMGKVPQTIPQASIPSYLKEEVPGHQQMTKTTSSTAHNLAQNHNLR
jgi:hypothetical protein